MMPETPSFPSPNDDKLPNITYDVVIIGAGPVGLATALGLRQRGIENILVIDQTRAFRKVGQVIDLLPNGLNALKYTDEKAYEQIKEVGGVNKPQPATKQTPKWIYKNFNGQTIRLTPLSYDSWYQDYGEGRVSIAWFDLQTTLRSLLPDNQVVANRRCINVVEEPEHDCVRIDYVSDLAAEANPYAHWQDSQQDQLDQPQHSDFSQTQSLWAKLVVAADGINSTVRRVLYQDTPYQPWATPEYSGFAALRCIGITGVSQELTNKLNQKFFHDCSLMTIFDHATDVNSDYLNNPRMMLFRFSGQLGYILHLPLSLDSFLGKSGNTLADLAKECVTKGRFPEEIKALVKLSPPEKMAQRPYYLHRASLKENFTFPTTANLQAVDNQTMEMPWSQGRVVLVGDAAHGMPPFTAQGGNQGLEDALVVSRAIAEIDRHDDWDNLPAIAQAWQKYESLRRPLMTTMQKLTLSGIYYYYSASERAKYGQMVYGRNFADMSPQ